MQQIFYRKVLPPAGVRSFWGWLNIIFNHLDEGRRKQLGPDRTCAEWLLRNGAAVRWKGDNKFLADYNALPPESSKVTIEEVDATESSIMHYGFRHFEGCNHINKLKLYKCNYLEDSALAMLSPLNKSLRHLEVVACGNITNEGLTKLCSLTNLETLSVADLPYLKNTGDLELALKSAMPQCKLDFKN